MIVIKLRFILLILHIKITRCENSPLVIEIYSMMNQNVKKGKEQ